MLDTIPEGVVWAIVILPLAAFIINGVWLRSSQARYAALVTIAAVGAAFVLALWALDSVIQSDGVRIAFDGHELLAFADIEVNLGLNLDGLTAVMLIVVLSVSLLVQVYSQGYMAGDGGYTRYYAYMSLFTMSMLGLILVDSLILIYVFWEMVGLCSYLLIGFWFHRPAAAAAAKKAFLVTRLGDLGFLLAILLIYVKTGTFDVAEVQELALAGAIGSTTLTVFALGIFAGAAGKSAQVPFHVWLPDAMEGPTPVSAMIHAATMVSAGVYMIIRMFPLLSAGWAEGGPLTPAMWAMAFIGAFTAPFASTIAVAQRDIKRVLAYSTISQLGYMVAALGIGAYVAAAFHLITHAFFKALLFLGSGSVIHGVEHGDHEVHEHLHDHQDMFNFGGLRKRMPVTFWTFLLGGLALSGFPLLTAGFWSKDEILADAFANGHFAVFITLAVAAFLTAFYTARQISLTFLGEPRSESAAHAPENVWTMTLPLVVLAFFAVTAGWIGIPDDFLGLNLGEINWFHPFVGATLLEHPEAAHFNIVPLLTSLAVALGGLFVGWWVYGRKPLAAGAPDPLEAPLGSVYTLLRRKYYFDELYDVLFVRPAYWFSEQVAYLFIDKKIIDGALHAVGAFSVWLGGAFRNYIDAPVINGFADLVGESVKAFGRSFRIIQTGRVQNYLLVVLWAVLAFGALFFIVAR